MADTALDLSSKPGVDLERASKFLSRTSTHSNSGGSGRNSPASSVHSDGNESDSSLKNSVFDRRGSNPPVIPHGENSNSTSIKSEEDAGGSDKLGSPTVSRPFKMYPMDPFSIYNMATTTPSSPLSPTVTSPAALGVPPAVYENPAGFPGFPLAPLTSHLLQRKRRSESRPDLTDPKKTKPVPEEKKDDAYWERRRKNNEAAKRSRDARRHKEEEIAMRAAFLEQENLKLRAQVAILKNETAKLHYMLYNRLWDCGTLRALIIQTLNVALKVQKKDESANCILIAGSD